MIMIFSYASILSGGNTVFSNFTSDEIVNVTSVTGVALEYNSAASLFSIS